MLLTKIFRSPTRVLDESIFQFCQLKVTDNNFGVLQTIKVHQVLQLHEQTNKGAGYEIERHVIRVSMYLQRSGEMLLVSTRCQRCNIPSDFYGQFSESAGKLQLPTPAS